MACEEYLQEVLGFSNVIASDNPTPYYDPIVSTSSPSITSFGDSDFILEEVDAFLAFEDHPTSSEVDQSYFDPNGDILLLEAFLNDDPSLPFQIKETISLKFERSLKFVKPKLRNLQLMSLSRLNLRTYHPILNTHFWKANDVILKNMQTNMTSLKNSNLELKNMFGQFMKMNTASSSGSGTLPGNTITKPKEDLKGITTRSGTAYQGPTIPTTSSLPKVVEHDTKVTKDTVPPTNNESTKDVQPSVVQIETPILNSEPVVAPIIEPVVAPVSPLKPNHKP
nr:reverse transcriptase domain-containing protein [Tanacetum cinerariifolium]